MRLFVAIEIPDQVRENLRVVLRDLGAGAPGSAGAGLRWVTVKNLHITLKFIGEIADEQFHPICAALNTVISPPAPLELDGLAFSPSEKRARVLWLQIRASAELSRLAASVEGALEPLGIERERRAFTPHLTLARLKNPRVPAELRKAVAEGRHCSAGHFRASEFRLIESKLKSSGAEYTTRRTFPLVGA